MPHIDFKNDFPGTRSALAYRPETAAPLGELAEILLMSNEGSNFMRKIRLIRAALFYILLLPVVVLAQQNNVNGKVTDTKDFPLPGTTITITAKQSGRVTTTDKEGRFSLESASGSNIVISCTGYKPVTIKAENAQGDLQVKLEEDFAKLEEIVVTRLATSVKRKNHLPIDRTDDDV